LSDHQALCQRDIQPAGRGIQEGLRLPARVRRRGVGGEPRGGLPGQAAPRQQERDEELPLPRFPAHCSRARVPSE